MSAENVALLVERVQNGAFNDLELINLFDNARKRDVTTVMDAIKLKLRADFPRAATRKFGPMEKAPKTLRIKSESKIAE